MATVGGNDTYGITRNPFCYGWRARGCGKSGIEISMRGGLSRFGLQVMRNTLLLLVYVYLVFLD